MDAAQVKQILEETITSYKDSYGTNALFDKGCEISSNLMVASAKQLPQNYQHVTKEHIGDVIANVYGYSERCKDVISDPNDFGKAIGGLNMFLQGNPEEHLKAGTLKLNGREATYREYVSNRISSSLAQQKHSDIHLFFEDNGTGNPKLPSVAPPTSTVAAQAASVEQPVSTKTEATPTPTAPASDAQNATQEVSKNTSETVSQAASSGATEGNKWQQMVEGKRGAAAVGLAASATLAIASNQARTNIDRELDAKQQRGEMITLGDRGKQTLAVTGVALGAVGSIESASIAFTGKSATHWASTVMAGAQSTARSL